MTKDQFGEFIVKYELYHADGMIEITFKNGSSHKGVWVQSFPPLDESVDGAFPGKPEREVFFLFDKDDYIIVPVEEIDQVKCLQQDYLKGLPYQLAQDN
ncbi:MAG: hypothetical protein WCK18_19170 [Prolixibacteraceae bacterium]